MYSVRLILLCFNLNVSLFIRLFSHRGIFLLTEANIQMQSDIYQLLHRTHDNSSGRRRLHDVIVVRFFRRGYGDGLSGNLLKCSLISDLHYFFQVFIRNSLIYTIISTTFTVICVNILHDSVKVNTQNSTPNTNMAAPSKWRAAFEGHFETLMRNI